ncbi:hypothetical protein ACFV6Y_39130 [Streptomyces massasporeus]|uniref:hypothetical protein n=1 Tax=Streptomyces massasporeus TaxID=67324 RepID=UPI003669C0E0
MALCEASKYEWGGYPKCTLPEGHNGEEHVAEGLINHNTGKAPVIATWPVDAGSPAEPETEPERRVKWKRTGPGRYIGRVDRQVRYGMTKVAERWILTTQPGGGIIGTAPTVAAGKDVAERDLAARANGASS